MEEMNINRYNYQEYFLLYTDNELRDADRRDVEDFIQENPDLREELLTMQQSVFKPDEEIVFEDKELLLQFEEENFIHPGNFEELCISYADNELNKEEKNRLERFVRAHPHLKQGFDLILSLKLPADKSIVFPDKEGLYRTENEKQPVIVPWWRMVAAAIVILIGGFLWLNNRPDNTSIKKLARTSETEPAKIASVTNKKEQPVNEKADKTVETVKDPAERLVISGNKKTRRSQKATPLIKYTGKKVLARENSFAETISSKSLDGKKQETAVQAKVKDQLQEDPKDNSSVVAEIDPLRKIPGKMDVEQPAVIINALDNYSHNTSVSGNEANENVVLTNIPVDRKNSLREIFRKATRFIDKNTAFRPSKQSSLLIGNIEIAFQ